MFSFTSSSTSSRTTHPSAAVASLQSDLEDLKAQMAVAVEVEGALVQEQELERRFESEIEGCRYRRKTKDGRPIANSRIKITRKRTGNRSRRHTAIAAIARSEQGARAAFVRHSA